MAAVDLITLADFLRFNPVEGSDRAAAIAGWITAASRAIENEINRRARYRAPAEVDGAGNVVAARTLQNENVPGGALTQPNAAGRTLIVTAVDADGDGGITAGTITVTGSVLLAGVATAGQTEVFDLAYGLEQHGVKFWTQVDSIVAAGLVGQEAGDQYKVGTSVGYVEEHTLSCSAELRPLEWPIQHVLEIRSDASRAFGSSTKLTEGTDFIVSKNDERRGGGVITRTSSRLPYAWMDGWRANKLTLSGGYTAAGVPDELRSVCRRLARLGLDELDKGRLGISGASDGAGNWTRWAGAALNREMRGDLDRFYRRRWDTDTGERDWDVDAA